MLNRWVERDGLLDTLDDAGRRVDRLHAAGAGDADGQISERHSRGQPGDAGQIAEGGLADDEMIRRLNGLNDIAEARGQTLAQMAMAWVLRGGPGDDGADRGLEGQPDRGLRRARWATPSSARR